MLSKNMTSQGFIERHKDNEISGRGGTENLCM